MNREDKSNLIEEWKSSGIIVYSDDASASQLVSDNHGKCFKRPGKNSRRLSLCDVLCIHRKCDTREKFAKCSGDLLGKNVLGL